MFLFKWFKSSHPEEPPQDTVTIMDLPDLVMRKILEDVDFVSMSNLRKVNRAFQIFIDETQPNVDLEAIHVDIGADYVKMELTSDETESILFKKSEHECTINNYINHEPQFLGKETNVSFLGQFENCLDRILTNQNSKLSILSIRTWPKNKRYYNCFFGAFAYCCCSGMMRSHILDFNEVRETIRQVLNITQKLITSRKIQMEKLEIVTVELEQAVRLVSTIIPEFSENNVIYGVSRSDIKKRVNHCYFLLNLQNLKNPTFEKVFMCVPLLKARDFLTVREILYSFRHCEAWQINFLDIANFEEFHSVGKVLGKFRGDNRHFAFEGDKCVEVEVRYYYFAFHYAVYRWIEK